MDLRRQLMEGIVDLPWLGSLVPGAGKIPPFVVLDEHGVQIEPIAVYLRDVSLGDASPLTCRSYGFDLLRWWRLLDCLSVPWERATEAEVAVLVSWLRHARNQQRQRRKPDAAPAGSVNLRTGKPALRPGYSPRTINHALSVISKFYEFHSEQGEGPVINPVPASQARRRALAHHSPLDPKAQFKRARLRQKVADQTPRAIPDKQWDELFEQMRNDRDRALLQFYVSSGARASELLGVGLEDIEWAGLRIWVISKGTRLRQAIPADPQAFVYLARYLDQAGLPPEGQPVWQSLRGETRPVSYWAMRRVLQRANDRLGTNWTLHDLRHTAATRMVNDPELALHEVQEILRHVELSTTGVYLRVRIEELFDKLQAHYNRPRPQVAYPSGYDADDVAVVFGG